MASKASLGGFQLPFLGRAWITAAFAMILLLLGVGLVVANERVNARQQSRRATVQAEILAGSVAGALAFDDPGTAREYVNALRANHEIQAAGIYDDRGLLVAGYSAGAQGLPKRASPHEALIVEGALSVVVPVSQNGLRLGTVYLRTDLEPWSRRASRYLALGIFLALTTLLIAILGSSYTAASQAFAKLQKEVKAREQAETALRQSQKMEAMGQLTGGVAHDFNNLLMAASSGVDLLERTDDPKKRLRLLQGVRDAHERGAKLTQQLLTFARKTQVKPEVVDVGARLQGIRDLLDRSLREDVAVRFRLERGLWPIEVDAGQFDIAIVNIAVNARDAMPRGGQIEIAASNAPGALEGEDAVAIYITDQGTGMVPEAIDKAFEPFFTTKGVGHGTGLGLSQVYGFARAAGGTSSIESEAGEGTTVTLLLPRCRRAATAHSEIAPGAVPDLKSDNLLVVEDDDHVAALLLEMLAELGCKAIRVSTAKEGLAWFEHDVPDALISDMVMPGDWSGLDLVREVRRRMPDIPVLLMTGYSTAAEEARDEGYMLLEKPFSMEQLAHALAGICESK
jgi:signal transduction histidine kinase/CheY-like chemotaxis protein